MKSDVCKKKKISSPAGNRTRVFRVTGGDTHHYTTEEWTLTSVQLEYLNKCHDIVQLPHNFKATDTNGSMTNKNQCSLRLKD